MFVVGIDIGGTFTDVVIFDELSGRIEVTKIPSDPGREGDTVLEGLRELEVDPTEVHRIVHGTTVATNAILEGKGGRVALLTTKGFRDLLEIGRGRRLTPGSIFDPHFIRPKPLVPRHLRFELTERMLPGGEILTALDENETRRLGHRLKELGVDAVAVCFLHSYADPSHERAAASILREILPGVPISLSAEVTPEYREFERFSTAALNAYVTPAIEQYVTRLQSGLHAGGYTARLFIMSSSAGVMTPETAAAYPVRTLLSGPAGGVNGGIFFAREAGLSNVITYDMGGTSTDVCLVRDLTAEVQMDRVLRGFPVKTPQLGINTVGAGGGSIAWVDVGDILQIGPQSAGAQPGPACYGMGGAHATVTDANLVLGRLNPNAALGNRIPVRANLAEQAIAHIAERLDGGDVHRTAGGILRLTVAKMVNAIREISLERGYDPRGFALVAMGGSGPMHAAEVGADLEINTVLIPMHPGNVSAFGLLCSDVRHEYSKTVIASLGAWSWEALQASYDELEEGAALDLQSEGFAAGEAAFVPSLDMRYVGQAFEMNIPFSIDGATLLDIGKSFHSQHARRFGHSNESGEIEVVNLRLSAVGDVRKPSLVSDPSAPPPLSEAVVESRAVYFDGEFVSCPVYRREHLPKATSFQGPAIVEEFGATTVIPPAWSWSLDAYGSLRLERR